MNNKEAAVIACACYVAGALSVVLFLAFSARAGLRDFEAKLRTTARNEVVAMFADLEAHPIDERLRGYGQGYGCCTRSGWDDGAVALPNFNVAVGANVTHFQAPSERGVLIESVPFGSIQVPQFRPDPARTLTSKGNSK